VNSNEQARAIAELCKENQLLHPTLSISRVAWPKKTILDQKLYSSFILDTTNSETANQIITKSLIYKGELKTYVCFHSELRVTRYLRCQSYGYITRMCKNNEICAECADNYITEKCPNSPETSRKCAVCKGSHRAGAHKCEVERRERQRVNTARNRASALYPCQSTYLSPSPFQTASTSVLLLISPTCQQPQPPKEGWQIVTKGLRGRPSLLQQAAKDPAQSQIVIN
jgi:hypothetical protein